MAVCIAVRRRGVVTLFSRNRKVLNKRFPKVVIGERARGFASRAGHCAAEERHVSENTLTVIGRPP